MMSLCQSVLFNLPHCSVSSSSFRGQSNKSLQSHTATSFTSLVRQKRRSVSCNIRLFLPNDQLFCPPQCLPALLPYATSVAGLKTLRLLGRKKANSYLCHQNSVCANICAGLSDRPLNLLYPSCKLLKLGWLHRHRHRRLPGSEQTCVAPAQSQIDADTWSEGNSASRIVATPRTNPH